MKKTVPSIVLFLILGLTNVRASTSVNEHVPSKNNAPVVHNILSDKLPARLLTPIKKAYKDYWITNLYRTTSNGKTSYCITVENADEKVMMSATASSKWSVTNVIVKE